MVIVNKNQISFDMLLNYIKSVDKDFLVPISSRINIDEYCKKIFNHADLYAVIDNKEIASLVVFYANDFEKSMAYITLLVTSPKFKGLGLAKQLMSKAIDYCKNISLKSISLHTDKNNVSAISLYKKLGFEAINDSSENEKYYFVLKLK